jgi:hypothetical protein
MAARIAKRSTTPHVVEGWGNEVGGCTTERDKNWPMLLTLFFRDEAFVNATES